MKIKRLGTLMLLLAFLTVGGVYATWTFADGKATLVQSPIQVTLSGASYSSLRGTFEITAPTMTIDQESENSRKAVIRFSDALTVKFTPNTTNPDLVNETIIENGIIANVTMSSKVNPTYAVDANGRYQEDGTATPLFDIDDSVFVISPVGTAEAARTWTKQDDGSFIYIFSTTELADLIRLNNFSVYTFEEYQIFSDAVINSSVGVSITDPTVSGGT